MCRNKAAEGVISQNKDGYNLKLKMEEAGTKMLKYKVGLYLFTLEREW